MLSNSFISNCVLNSKKIKQNAAEHFLFTLVLTYLDTISTIVSINKQRGTRLCREQTADSRRRRACLSVSTRGREACGCGYPWLEKVRDKLNLTHITTTGRPASGRLEYINSYRWTTAC